MAEELIPREELKAAVEARRELGPDYEDELVASFAEKLERQVEERLAKRRPEPTISATGQAMILGLSSLGMGIPITAAAADAGELGVVVAWAGIAAVNFAFALTGRRR